MREISKKIDGIDEDQIANVLTAREYEDLKRFLKRKKKDS